MTEEIQYQQEGGGFLPSAPRQTVSLIQFEYGTIMTLAQQFMENFQNRKFDLRVSRKLFVNIYTFVKMIEHYEVFNNQEDVPKLKLSDLQGQIKEVNFFEFVEVYAYTRYERQVMDIQPKVMHQLVNCAVKAYDQLGLNKIEVIQDDGRY